MSVVHEPRSLSDLTAVLRRAHADSTPVRVTSHVGPTSSYVGPTFRSGVAPEPKLAPTDILLSLTHMAASIEHCAGDLTATVPAGVTLAETNRVLAQGGQWLALDPPCAQQATIGAIVATNASGPRRHRYGTSRDLIIGVEMALADGRLAKAGGRVVKNVAGYDLARLMCGSFGSLAVITSATFKLSPAAPASRTVVIEAADAAATAALVDAISAAPMTPTALELEAPSCRVLVRFESTPVAAEHQAAAAMDLASQYGARARLFAGDEEQQCWAAYERRTWEAPATLFKLSILPATLVPVLRLIEHAVAAHPPLTYSLAGRAALGVLFLRLHERAEAHAALGSALQKGLTDLGGHLAIQEIAADVVGPLQTVDLGDARPLMQALKNRFDPRNILNPGGGPAGL